MYFGCRRFSIVTSFVLAAIVIILLYKEHHSVTIYGRFVALESNGGRVGNQLFHLCSGYAIAKKLNRRHYIRTLDVGEFHIAKHIQKIEEIFPRLRSTFVVMEVPNEHREPFAQKDGKMTCCEYEDPIRLENRTEQFLVLEYNYAQNVRYFEPILPEIRYLLEFSDKVKQEGDMILKQWKERNASSMCVHIRRSDFIELNLATNLTDSVRKTRRIAAKMNLTQFLIFGDDIDFMRRMTEALHPNVEVRCSTNSEGVDFYIASKMCGAMLMTATTSTFGWWLAFFSPNQNAVYYNNDFAKMADKTPNKDLFLSSWQMYSDE